jgi:hypothetical protein
MVMPCSRSAARPSSSSASSTRSSPRFSEVRATAAYWSSKMQFVS